MEYLLEQVMVYHMEYYHYHYHFQLKYEYNHARVRDMVIIHTAIFKIYCTHLISVLIHHLYLIDSVNKDKHVIMLLTSTSTIIVVIPIISIFIHNKTIIFN